MKTSTPKECTTTAKQVTADGSPLTGRFQHVGGIDTTDGREIEPSAMAFLDDRILLEQSPQRA